MRSIVVKKKNIWSNNLGSLERVEKRSRWKKEEKRERKVIGAMKLMQKLILCYLLSYLLWFVWWRYELKSFSKFSMVSLSFACSNQEIVSSILKIK